MKREGSAEWSGDLRSGKGTISTESGALNNLPYGFDTRFGDAKGTNPEELIGAALASCFSMALSNELTKAGITNARIATVATVELKQVGGVFTITASHLDLTVRAPGSEKSAVESAANKAKSNCPVSKLLNAEVTMTASYEV